MTIHREMFDNEESKPTVMVSGGFDPVHAGHIRMIRHAAEFGDVIVIANSDDWLFRKKGFVFMEWPRRVEILNAIKQSLSEPKLRTKDLAGSADTQTVGKAIEQIIK